MQHPAQSRKKKPSPCEGGRAGRIVLPPHAPGLRIGLFGGSFNPPHAAHRAASLLAMKRLGLDRVWWIVSPGNPLKDNDGLPPLADRMAAARRLAGHPGIAVTDIEAQIGTRYTVDTLRFLRRRCPQVRFVWIAGADVLAEFHRWRAWREIFRLVPLAFVDRAGETAALAAPAAHTFQKFRLPEAAARQLADYRPPAWVFLHGMKSGLSSTALRQGARRRPV
jgi:nicotinate-nucleotide adenylyltransferase